MFLNKNERAPSPTRHRSRLSILAVCLAFQATGMGLLFTVFARKINAFGGGMVIFGLSATIHSLAILVAAPWMGALSDRFARRRLLSVSLLVSSIASLGYLLAPNAASFIIVRIFGGVLTAGMVPGVAGRSFKPHFQGPGTRKNSIEKLPGVLQL